MEYAPMMQVAAGELKGAIDAAISSPDYRTRLAEASHVNEHSRFLGERIKIVSFDYIFEQQYENKIGANRLSMSEVIRLLHIVSTPAFVLEYPDESKRSLKSGEWRRHGVEFGDKVGANEKDISHLMSLFGSKLESLIKETTNLKDADVVATWAYAVFTAIHPFEDGNGRTSRALAEYIRYSVARRNGQAYESLYRPNVVEAAGEKVADELTEMQYLLDLFPNAHYLKGKKYAFHYDSAREYYENHKDEYFEKMRTRVQDAIHIVTLDDLLKNEYYESTRRLAKKINKIGKWKDYRTKSLPALEAVKAYELAIERYRARRRQEKS